VGEVILRQLNARGQSQAAFAEQIGLNYQMLSQCIHGWRRIPRSRVHEIARALGLEGHEISEFVALALAPPLKHVRRSQSKLPRLRDTK
jgi:DNA-binding transcriptional regulator YdaS (Cro superfamily)